VKPNTKYVNAHTNYSLTSHVKNWKNSTVDRGVMTKLALRYTLYESGSAFKV